jgi:sarcosine oxidase, subunit alpha
MKEGERIELLDREGAALGSAELASKRRVGSRRTWLLRFRTSEEVAARAIGLRAQPRSASEPLREPRFSFAPDEATLCRCERVSFGEAVRFIRENRLRDASQLKILRAGMGSCGSKTCAPLFAAAFRAAGVDPSGVAPARLRPLEVELPLGALARAEAPPAEDPAMAGARGRGSR